jgi:hypothetical protein
MICLKSQNKYDTSHESINYNINTEIELYASHWHLPNHYHIHLPLKKGTN